MTGHSNAAASAAVTTNQGQLITSAGVAISVSIMFTIRRQVRSDGDGAVRYQLLVVVNCCFCCFVVNLCVFVRNHPFVVFV